MLKRFLGKRKIELDEVDWKTFDEALDACRSPQSIFEIKQFVDNNDISKYYFGHIPGERRVYKVETTAGEIKIWNLTRKSRRRKNLFFIF
ncbi:MAG: hypothetical protein IKG42_02710 [Clostridia bacterium]|nr:hypothetical protein [Clostridia bacterium]